MRKRAPVTNGSANIFRDLGFSEARSAELILKSSMLRALQETIRSRGFGHPQRQRETRWKGRSWWKHVLGRPPMAWSSVFTTLHTRDVSMRKELLAVVSLLGLTVLASGCPNYYLVTDPASGKSYYTNDIDEAGRAGAVKFKDEKSGSVVTLQSSEVKEISSKEFEAALKAEPAPKN